MKKSVKGENLLIEHEGLKLEFQDELVDHVMALDDGFGDFFKCIEGICFFVNGLINSTEFTLS